MEVREFHARPVLMLAEAQQAILRENEVSLSSPTSIGDAIACKQDLRAPFFALLNDVPLAYAGSPEAIGLGEVAIEQGRPAPFLGCDCVKRDVLWRRLLQERLYAEFESLACDGLLDILVVAIMRLLYEPTPEAGLLHDVDRLPTSGRR